MSSTFSARIDYGLTGEHPVCELSGIAANLVGHDAVLSLRLRVDVKRSSGVDANKQVFEQAVKVTATQLRVPIASTLIQGYRYKGHKIDIEMVAKLRVDDGVIFDTTLEAPVDAPLLTPQGDAAQAAHRANSSLMPRSGSNHLTSTRLRQTCAHCRPKIGSSPRCCSASLVCSVAAMPQLACMTK